MATEAVLPDQRFATVRRWPRYKLDVPMRLIATKGDKSVIVQGRGNELNEGGMALFAGVELGENEQVAVEFTPPYSGNPIRVRAVVRNRNGYVYGVEFLLETDDDFDSVGQIRAVLGGMGSRTR